MNALFIRIAPFLFKPSLDHQNPKIRLLALNRLDLSADQQQSTVLNWLKQEEDQQLLKEALARFPNQQKLIELLNLSQPSSQLNQALSQHLELTLLKDTQLNSEKRHTLALQITDPALLLKIIQQAETQELRLALLERLEATEEDWLDLALSNSLARVRQAAAEKITSETALEQLIKQAQGDKSVNRIAREKLNAYRAAQQAEAAAAQERIQLLEQLQKLVSVGDPTLYEARFEHLTNQWQALELAEDAQLTAQYEQLSQQAKTFIAKTQAEEAQRLAKQAKQEQAKQEQKQLLQTLFELVEALLAQPAQLEQTATNQIAAAWQASLVENTPSKSDQKAFDQQLALAEELTACSLAWQTTQPQLADLLAAMSDQPNPAELDQLSQLIASINWHKNLATPELMEQAKQRLIANNQEQKTARQAVEQTKKLNLNRLEQNLTQLEQLVSLGQSREAIRLHQQLQNEVEQLANNHRLAAVYRSLNAKIAELRDWQGYVAAPKREALCEQMEALAADDEMLPQVKADKIQALQQEWRELGSAAANKPLWDRFKQAADTAYEPCKAWFTAQNEVREYNQKQKAIICDELKQLASNQGHLAMEEEQLDELLKLVHEEWHRFNPVNRVEGKQLAQRFQQAIAPIRDQLYQLRQQHADNKRQLVEKAKELLNSEDLQAATETSKQIQQEWRTLGTAPGSLEHQLWKEFRTHCDALFKQRDEQRKNRLEERLQRFALARQQLAEAKEALATGEEQLAAKLLKQAAGLRNIPKKEQENWQAELDNLSEQLQRLAQQKARRGLAQKLSSLIEALPETGEPEDLKAAKRLIVELELLTGVPVAAEDQQLRLKLQIERMNSGLGSPTEESTQKEIQQLLEAWKIMGGSKTSQLSPRLMAAIEAYQNPS
ncbi:DUF349 domain-containing protein [Marinospirillum insulare]|uniref:DUF349 domain-containing protein n=1 Tax=Marinospirillum insulare TaxID=217169 RepID=A0ABQ5ZRP2_9GAMM|nr:DUF349 domain-containing protein [Marinospirillum insulare]GLR62815.1 hypothetical protein GCM10007878_02500 [Marinospirillum insulare]